MSYRDTKGLEFYDRPTNADVYQEPVSIDEIMNEFRLKGVNVDRSVFENAHSNIDTLINEYGPIKPNALMETSMAYQNPNAILKHLLPSKGKDTLLQDMFDLALRNDTKGLGDRLPSKEQTGGETGGLITALLRGILTGSYQRKQNPYLLDESK